MARKKDKKESVKNYVYHIPPNTRVLQQKGEQFTHIPEKGIYRTTVEHPELKEYLVD